MTTRERLADALRAASFTSAVVHAVCKRMMLNPGHPAVFRLLVRGAATDNRNVLEFELGTIPTVRLPVVLHTSSARSQSRPCALRSAIPQRFACKCSYTCEQRACKEFAGFVHVNWAPHRHKKPRRSLFSEQAFHPDIAIGSAIALRKMEYVFVVSATTPGRESGATELWQDKSRTSRLGRTAEKRRIFSVVAQCALLHRNVHFQQTHEKSMLPPHCLEYCSWHRKPAGDRVHFGHSDIRCGGR
jgi:hypothetical protein